MQPTADPWELQRQANRCRDLASSLDDAIQQLQSTVFSILTNTWTGTAAESLAAILQDEISYTQDAANELREAALAFDRGAGEVTAYRAAHANEPFTP